MKARTRRCGLLDVSMRLSAIVAAVSPARASFAQSPGETDLLLEGSHGLSNGEVLESATIIARRKRRDLLLGVQ